MKLITKVILTGITILDISVLPVGCSKPRHKWTEETIPDDTTSDTYVDSIWIVKKDDIDSYSIKSLKIVNDGDLIIEEPNSSDSFFEKFNVEYWYFKNTDNTEKRIEFPYTVIEEDYVSEFETIGHETYYNCIVLYAGGEITKNG